MSKLIIITGAPATGKTHLFNEISLKFKILSFYKDEFKEILFDSVKNLNLELSKELGIASYKTLFLIIEKAAKNNTDLLIEGNFRPKYDEPTLLNILEANNVQLFQILCETDYEVIKQRQEERKTSMQRHSGHFDLGREEEFKSQIENGDYRFFEIPSSKRILINTTDFSKVDFGNIYLQVEEFLKE